MNVTPPVPLQASHLVEEFSCGEPSLDDWLKPRALRNQASAASRWFVLFVDQTVIGYYSVSAGAIGREAAPKAMRRNMPDPLPVLLPHFPSLDALVQQVDLIGRCPSVVGLCWFCLDHPDTRGGGQGLAQSGRHLAGAEWYAAWCRDAMR